MVIVTSLGGTPRFAQRLGMSDGRRNRMRGRVIGIDLGTTNSVVAVLEGDQPTDHR